MKLNPFQRQNPSTNQDSSDLVNYDESVLQQGRFWMKTVTWTLIGTTVFGVAWLALARTEEIVVAPGTLVPIGSVQDIQMPVGGVIDEILVEEGEKVEVNQILIKLDTEATAERQRSILNNLELKQKQLQLKEVELAQYVNLNQNLIDSINEKIKFEIEILRRLKKRKNFLPSFFISTTPNSNFFFTFKCCSCRIYYIHGVNIYIVFTFI